LAPALADRAPARTRRWGDLRLRIISAAVLAPIALVCVWVGRVPFLVLVAIITAGLVWEWLQLWRGARAAAPLFPPRTEAPGRDPSGPEIRPAPPPSPGPREDAAQDTIAVARPGIVPLLWGLLAILAAAVSVAWLRAEPRVGLYNLLFLLILVWCSDSGAYVTGRIVRGPKLAPRISPSKTVAGAAGGLAAAVLGGICVALAVPLPTSLWHAAMVAALLGVAAQAGDLVESYVKRRFGAKDSGRLIPGHGGLLDRLDALVAAALVAAVLALAQEPGVVLWG
jgi:phosphatidate cytidylyltransferase